MDDKTQKRLEEVYEMLVDQTENPITLHDYRKNLLLTKLLEVIEYIMGIEEENPVIDIF